MFLVWLQVFEVQLVMCDAVLRDVFSEVFDINRR